MKFSENWLRTFVDSRLPTRELADALTMSGLEVEAIEPAAPEFHDVVVAEVLDVERHPADARLSVCRVTAGEAPLRIVCGAPGLRAGMRVALAKVGARLPGGAIAQATIQGIESSGMLCSAAELGVGDDAARLLVLPGDAPAGRDLRAYLDADDQVFTIKPTPNRGDCLSVFGVAREVAAVTGCALAPVRADAVPAVTADRIGIVLEAPLGCPRYCGRIVRGVDARAATPAWMTQRLARSGLRSISAVVDITNYVMLEVGQPMHAFDFAHVDRDIHVRFGRDGEKLLLLNEQEVALGPRHLVIADSAKPLALAGIMGGAQSAVTAETRDILLESAFFEPAVIAGKSRELGFGSDSSFRFERGVDFEATRQAMERATRLVLDICGGEPGPTCEAAGGALPARKPVRMRRARAARVLGIPLSSREITTVLERLGFEFEASGDDFAVTPPSHRFDLAIEEDLIEEVARIHGYDRIPAIETGAAAAMLPSSEQHSSAQSVRAFMVARDYQEIVSYSFVDRQWEIDFCDNREPVALVNPIASQLSVMRSSLIGSLVDTLKLNLARQHERVRLFEIARCFGRDANGYREAKRIAALAYGEQVSKKWGMPARRVDFYDVKADLEALIAPGIARFVASPHPALHPGKSARVVLRGEAAGWLGELHPRLCQKYDCPSAPIVFEMNLDVISSRGTARYREFSRLPHVRRDISVEVDAKVEAQTMLEAMQKSAPAIVSEMTLFDVYRGKGIDSDKKSVAFRILLQDTLKTLTDTEVDAAIRRLVQVLQEKFEAKLRR